MVDYNDIRKGATRLSSKSSSLIFAFSGIGVFLFNLFPVSSPNPLLMDVLKIVNNGMYWVVFISCGYIGVDWFRSSDDSHHSPQETCLKCQKSLKYTGIVCTNPECNFKVKL